MAAYPITKTKNEKAAKRSRRFYEQHGIPCWIGKNRQTFVLYTIDEGTARRAKHLRVANY